MLDEAVAAMAACDKELKAVGKEREAAAKDLAGAEASPTMHPQPRLGPMHSRANAHSLTQLTHQTDTNCRHQDHSMHELIQGGETLHKELDC